MILGKYVKNYTRGRLGRKGGLTGEQEVLF